MIDENNINNIDKIVKPLFDMIWNCLGIIESPNFDENGNWKHQDIKQLSN